MKEVILTLILALLPSGFIGYSNNPQEVNKQNKRKILFVLTSHSDLGNTGKETGFYLSEAAHPWEVLKDHFTIEFVSPVGGKVPVDGFDLEDSVNKEFWKNAVVQKKLNNTKSPSEIDPLDYEAIHYVGGHGTMWDFPQNEKLAKIAARIYENNGVVSAVCHGPAGLVNVKLSDDTYLIQGRRVAGFSNAEEKAAGLAEVVPFLLENKLKERGADYSEGPKFTEHVVKDGHLVTGQNPQSAKKMAEIVLEILKEKQ
ncbi:type 1 glutamine amidotransferase domain-containing protein [Marinilabilia rubra]|uniref:Type 1 glutamine amidotransferase domain-containing protein n=1 Tax=Marinilabilia rubra TaxID=2162893 RepID=A0A2U2BAA7_9BACT|nr:type 1 glutamine amidotransferase domain-containing protein [Marinilabilia rubra]PWD99991.1 type 1 glutamine amidotransferase domain-containing protein [Marinilabilia rubra]